MPWLSPKDMAASFIASTQDHITEAAVAGSAASLIPANSVVFVVRSGILERKAPVAVVPFATTINQDMKSIAPCAAVYHKWLLYMLLSQEQTILHTCRKAGTTVASLDTARIRALQVPLPPLPEQHRIVEALEDHLSRLDSVARTLSAVNRRSAALAAALLDATILGATANAPMAVGPRADLAGRHARFLYSELPALPEGWKWQLADELCASINSGSTPSADLMQQGSGEVPFLKVYNISPSGAIDFTKNPTFVSNSTHRGQLRRSVAFPGDVVTNIVGPPLGKSAVVPDTHPEWNTNQAIVAFRAGASVRPEWLAACLRAPFIVNLMKGTARATAGQLNIALSTCRELPLPVPPLHLQNALLEQLETYETSLRHAGILQFVATQRSLALRRALLRAAFDGELVDQDPTDEPADVALARAHEQASTPTRARPRKTMGAR